MVEAVEAVGEAGEAGGIGKVVKTRPETPLDPLPIALSESQMEGRACKQGGHANNRASKED